MNRSVLQPISFLPSVQNTKFSQPSDLTEWISEQSQQEWGCCFALLSWGYLLILHPGAKGSWSLLQQYGFLGTDLQHGVLCHQFIVQLKEKHAIVNVHLSSKNDTWKRTDCLEIRKSSRGGFIMFNEEVVVDIFKIFFLIAVLCFSFLPEARSSVNSHPQLDLVY